MEMDWINKDIALPKNASAVFSRSSIYSVTFRVVKHAENDIDMFSYVEFRNGGTRGEQRFRSDDFNTLVEGTMGFINSLGKSE